MTHSVSSCKPRSKHSVCWCFQIFVLFLCTPTFAILYFWFLRCKSPAVFYFFNPYSSHVLMSQWAVELHFVPSTCFFNWISAGWRDTMSYSPRAFSSSLCFSVQREWVNRIKGTFALVWVELWVGWQQLHHGMQSHNMQGAPRAVYLGQIGVMHTLTHTITPQRRLTA